MECVFRLRKIKLNLIIELVVVHTCESLLYNELAVFRPVRKMRKGLLASSCLSIHLFVLPSVRIEQVGSHRTDFHEILCLRIFRKSIEKVKVALISDKNNGYFT
jgi:hypothetical protein